MCTCRTYGHKSLYPRVANSTFKNNFLLSYCCSNMVGCIPNPASRRQICQGPRLRAGADGRSSKDHAPPIRSCKSLFFVFGVEIIFRAAVASHDVPNSWLTVLGDFWSESVCENCHFPLQD